MGGLPQLLDYSKFPKNKYKQALNNFGDIMYIFHRTLILATIFASLVGCQTIPQEGIFMPRSNDSTLTTAVLENMLNDENLSTVTVHVETMNGVVQLTGYVKTIRQSDMAEELARKTPGVKSVQNNIIVRK